MIFVGAPWYLHTLDFIIMAPLFNLNFVEILFQKVNDAFIFPMNNILRILSLLFSHVCLIYPPPLFHSHKYTHIHNTYIFIFTLRWYWKKQTLEKRIKVKTKLSLWGILLSRKFLKQLLPSWHSCFCLPAILKARIICS